MRPKLTDKAIRYIVRQMKKGRRSKDVAEETGVTQRHARRLWAECPRTGTMPALGSAGRPKGSGPSDEEVQTVLDTCRRRPEGFCGRPDGSFRMELVSYGDLPGGGKLVT